jgi:hypothetical protein
MFEVARRVGIVYTEELILFVLERMLDVDNPLALLGYHFGDACAASAVVVYDVFGLIKV